MQNGASRGRPDDEQTLLNRVRPEDWINPEPRSGYDLAIVGAGPAGLAAAESAARLGFSVALIERNRLGGNSLNVGSVPSKAIIGIARFYSTMPEAEALGAPVPNGPILEFDKVMGRMRQIRMRISEHHSVHDLAALGIDIFLVPPDLLLRTRSSSAAHGCISRRR